VYLMAEWRPYWLVGYKSLSGSASGVLEIEVGATEEFEVDEIRIKSTSELFDITGITDQGGTPFTNADSTTVLDGMLLTNATENEYNIIKLKEPWPLLPQTKLTFEITDTSAATNEIWILLVGRMKAV